eukprot:747205-Hanusia_phi.AAC.6
MQGGGSLLWSTGMVQAFEPFPMFGGRVSVPHKKPTKGGGVIKNRWCRKRREWKHWAARGGGWKMWGGSCAGLGCDQCSNWHRGLGGERGGGTHGPGVVCTTLGWSWGTWRRSKEKASSAKRGRGEGGKNQMTARTRRDKEEEEEEMHVEKEAISGG